MGTKPYCSECSSEIEPKCGYCPSTFKDGKQVICILINDKPYHFCSKKCIANFIIENFGKIGRVEEMI